MSHFFYRFLFFFSSRRRHTRLTCDWSSDVCSSDLAERADQEGVQRRGEGLADRCELKGRVAVDRQRLPELIGRVAAEIETSRGRELRTGVADRKGEA